VHAILSTIAAPGTCLSLRKSARRKFSLEDMISMGTISVDAASILRRMVNAKLAFLISGGTGSGKTHAAHCPAWPGQPEARRPTSTVALCLSDVRPTLVEARSLCAPS